MVGMCIQQITRHSICALEGVQLQSYCLQDSMFFLRAWDLYKVWVYFMSWPWPTSCDDLSPTSRNDLWPTSADIWPISGELRLMFGDLWPTPSDMWPTYSDLWPIPMTSDQLWPTSGDLWTTYGDLWPISGDLLVTNLVRCSQPVNDPFY